MTVKIDQAFTSDFVAQAFGLPIAHENANYEPTEGVPYVAIRVFQNEEVGLDVADTNTTTGFFQFVLRYPQGTGAMAAKAMRDTIFAAYPVGRDITYSGQKVTTTSRYPFQSYPEDGWFKVVGRINYTALTDR